MLRHPALRNGLSIAISLIFIALVQHYYGWQTILAPWRDQPWHVIAGLMMMATCTLLLRAWRLYDYFRAELHGYFPACAKLMILHNLFNILLPMRTGELSFPLLMQNYFHISAHRSVPVLLWFRILDLHTVLALGLLAFGWQYWSPAFTALLILLWLPLPIVIAVIGARLGKITPDPEMRRWRRIFLAALAHLPRSRRHLARDWLWTGLNWLTKFMIFAWVVQLFLPVNSATALAGAIAGDLTAVLPIHGIAGSGTYEAGVMGGLSLFGIAPSQSLQAAINLHLFILATTLIAAAVVYPWRVRKITTPT